MYKTALLTGGSNLTCSKYMYSPVPKRMIITTIYMYVDVNLDDFCSLNVKITQFWMNVAGHYWVDRYT